MLGFRLRIALLIVCVGVFAARADSSPAVGVRAMTIAAPERGGTIDVALWYPAQPNGPSQLFGGTKVFAGVPAYPEAPMATGRFPMVLLAHGGLRAAPNIGNWIAADLAGRGYLVVVISPPRLDDAQAAISEIWLRPADLSAALSAVSRDPGILPHIVPEQVGVVGFLRGGTSALALAGARIDAERYRRSCDMPAGGPDCRWFAKNGIDLHALDPGPVARALLDPRIKVAVAVQPELADRFAPESLALIKIPVGIIGLGNEDDTAALARVIPGARQVRMPDATSFSTFGLCTPQGAALLQAEGEDEAVCREDGPRSRAEIHAELARLIAAMLRKGFARQP